MLCHEAKRPHIDGMERWHLPSLEECIELNLTTGRLTNPDVQFIGVSMNTSKLSPAEAEDLLSETADKLALPCVDPVRMGVGPIVDALEARYA